jgi:hypothetical protein
MTTPTDGFEYTDDSVIARVSFDIPGQALNDIGQLTQSMGAMRTQLEAVARAQGDWLEYLSQVPEITERANQTLRDQITLLERMSYIQNEIGGGSIVGGGQGYGSGPGGPGAGGYSTAAPAGYVNPWQGMTAGMGMGGGGLGGGNAGAVGERLEQIGSEDPRLEANMQSARGMAVNPALVAMLGGTIASAIGKGNRYGASNSQKNGKKRKSSAPPNGDDGGAPETSESPDAVADPHDDAPDDQKREGMLSNILNEARAGGYGRSAGDLISKIGGKIGGLIPGGGSGGGIAGGIGQKVLTGILNQLKTPQGLAVGGAALGGLAFNTAQNLGEKYTQFQQLGSVQGGDAMTGMKYEAQARLLALNPFITTQQARQAMQMALKEGFRGDNYDTVQDFMISNFKDLGISMGQSMDLMKTQALGMTETDDKSSLKDDLNETLNTMKELSAEGGASFPERANQLQELSAALSGDGLSPENIRRSAIGMQEAYGGDLALRDSYTGIVATANKDTMFKTMVANKVGITGMLPGALGPALDQAGVDADEVMAIGAEVVAKQVSGHGNRLNRIANFMSIMNNVYGQSLKFEEAEALYAPHDPDNKGAEKPLDKANRRVARQGNTQTKGGGRGVSSSNPSDADWNSRHGNYAPSGNAAGVADDFAAAGRGSNNFAPAGQTPQALPQNAAQASSQTINTQGVVSGEVRITVDQAGRVSAPSVIQLTGQQKSANAGYGSSQLNSAPPGDPTYMHAYNSFPTAGGG